MELVKSTIIADLPKSERAALRSAAGRGRFLGIAQRSPVMQNGQVPGIPRQYNHTYALLVMEMIGKGKNKPGTIRAVMRTQAKGGEL